MTRDPVYSAYIDWHGHGGLTMGLAGWHYRNNQTGVVTLSTTHAYLGTESLRMTPQTFTTGDLARSFTLPGGIETTIHVWVYNPTGGNSQINLAAFSPTAGSLGSANTTTKNAWTEITLAVEEPASTEVSIIVGRTGVDTTPYYLGWAMLTTEDDDVSCKLLATRDVPSVVYGRDSARDLAEVRPGETGISLRNEDGAYTPNGVSTFSDKIAQDHQVVMMTEVGGQRNLFYSGYTNDFKLNGKYNDRSVTFNCVDLLTRLNEVNIHTELYESIRTGDAITAVIDAAGLHATLRKEIYAAGTWSIYDPYVETGGSTLVWWSFSGPAKEALDDILQSEGPPAIYGVGVSNQIVFRDRHHRVRTTYPSATNTLVSCDDGSLSATEFLIHDESDIDYGRKTFYNRVELTSSVRNPAAEISVVWTDPVKLRTITGREVITVELDSGFIEGQTPIPGKRIVLTFSGLEDDTDVSVGTEPDDADFIVESGSVTVEEFAASGTQMRITMVAAGVATISGLQFRARAVSSDEQQQNIDDTGSQTFFKAVRPHQYDAGAASPQDGLDIAGFYLKKNSSPRPMADFVLKNRTEDYTKLQLAADVSQPFNVTHDEWGIEAVYTVEGIEHEAGELGKDHETVLHTQQEDPIGYTNTLITFDEVGHGFDFGVFAKYGALPFVFGDAAQGFDDGAFGLNANTDVPFILGHSTLNSSDEIWY